MTDFLQHLHPAWLALIRVLLLVVPILILVPGLIWWERRLLSWMQDRIGPNRVGPYGLLQPIADGVKLFFKEDITPTSVDRKIYFLAPAIALFPAFALGGTMPWGPDFGLYALLTPVANIDIGVLYVIAISSLGVYGVVLAGYAANNKYSLMGGLRASAQLISYELAMGIALACVAMGTGSLRMSDMVRAQEGPFWGVSPYVQNWFIFTPYGFVAAIIFAICVIAETNRAPFDLPEAENELIAGYHTEYSSMKFAVFFMGEYAAMFLFSGIFAAVFLGGYNVAPFNWNELAHGIPSLGGFFGFMDRINYWFAPAWFIGKCAFGITCFVWLRATLPRLRYDQLMALGWKSLLPLGVANFITVAIWIVGSKLWQPIGGIGAAATAVAILVILYLNWVAIRKKASPILEKRTLEMVSEQQPRTVELVESGKGAR